MRLYLCVNMLQELFANRTALTLFSPFYIKSIGILTLSQRTILLYFVNIGARGAKRDYALRAQREKELVRGFCFRAELGELTEIMLREQREKELGRGFCFRAELTELTEIMR